MILASFSFWNWILKNLVAIYCATYSILSWQGNSERWLGTSNRLFPPLWWVDSQNAKMSPSSHYGSNKYELWWATWKQGEPGLSIWDAKSMQVFGTTHNHLFPFLCSTYPACAVRPEVEQEPRSSRRLDCGDGQTTGGATNQVRRRELGSSSRSTTLRPLILFQRGSSVACCTGCFAWR